MQEQLKVVIVGDGTVGKTTFLNRWANDIFNTYILNCFDTKICVVDGKEVSVTLWDTGRSTYLLINEHELYLP